MYKIEKKPFGFKLTFSGLLSADDLKKWGEESKKALTGAPKSFGVFIDMRELKPLAPDAQEPMKEGQALYKNAGMERSVVIVQSATTAMQFKRIATKSGISAWERYIAAGSEPEWEKKGLAWLTDGTDPD